MSLRDALILAVTASLAAGADAQNAPAAGAAAPADAKAKAKIENCNARKFETTIEVSVAGKPRRSKVKLCGQEGQSDADWARTLGDAIKKVEANDKMPAEIKKQIATAINAEIARLGKGGATAIAALPALPALPQRPARPAERPPEYAVLPPMPAPVRTIAAAPMAAPRVTLARPRLTIECLNPSDLAGPGPCTAFERDTMVTVRAGEALDGGTSLRFDRRGDMRSDLALAKMRRGQSRQFRLPAELCRGVTGSEIELQIVRRVPGSQGPDQLVGSEGRYLLRC
jgi:hypothetical protein